MGYAEFKAAEAKRKKEEQDKLKKEASKPLLMRGVQTAPQFSPIQPAMLGKGPTTMGATQSKPINFGAYQQSNQSVPTTAGFRYAAPPQIQPKVPTPGPQSSMNADPIFRTQPTLRGSLTTPTMNVIKPIAQSVARGFMSSGAAIAGVPTQFKNIVQNKPAPIGSYTPIEKWEKAIFGTDKPISFQSEGESFGVKNPALATAVGVGLSLSDLSGTGAVSKHVSLKGIRALLHADDIKYLDDVVRAAKAGEVVPEKHATLIRNMLMDYNPKLRLPASKKGLMDFVADAVKSADTVAAREADEAFTAGFKAVDAPATRAGFESPANVVARALPKKQPTKSFLQRVNDAVSGKFKWIESGDLQRGFIKNPFFRGDDAAKIPLSQVPTPPKGTGQLPSQLPEPSQIAKPLSDLTPEQSLSLSKDVAVFNASKVPEVNLSKLDISGKGKELIKQTADEIKPRLEQLIGKPLTNKEVLDHAQFTSQTFKKAITKEQTKKWEVALTATRQKLAAMAETGIVDREFIETLETVRTVASDAGRKLQAFAVEAKPAEITLKQFMLENMLDLGNKADELVKAAEGVDFNNMKEAAIFYRKFVKPSARELIDTLRYNSMLSSPLTHIVNIASNAINTTMVAPIEKALLGGVDFLSSKITGNAQKHFAGESGVYLKAYAGAVQEATSKFIDVMKGSAATTNLDLRHIPLAPQGGVAGAAEAALSVPMKLLEGMDQFFMTLGNAAETAAMQYKASKGLKITPSDIALEASKKAAYRVFRQELFSEGQGTVLNAIDTFTQTLFSLRNNKNPIVAWPARLTVPFVQTPMNIFKQGLEYSPAGYFTMIGAADKSEQLTKAVMGSSVAAVAGLYAANGRLSWAEPTNEAERNAFRDAGKQPYSIKIGDNWVSYQKLPPVLAFPVSMIALTYDAMNQQKLDESTGELILRSFAKYAQFMSDQSYAKSFGDLLGAFSGSESDIARLASNYPQQFIPYRALTGWLARLTDDVQRKPDPDGTFVEKQVQLLMMNYPGLSKKVPARVNEEGEEIKAQNPILNAVSPFRVSTEDSEKSALFQGIMDIKKMESDASARNRVLKDQAEDEVIRIATQSRGEQRRTLREMKKSNPALAEKVQDLLDQEEFEYTGFEKKLKDASTDTRAQMILKQLKGMEKASARKLKLDYKKRKIITDAVEDRMREIERESR